MRPSRRPQAGISLFVTLVFLLTLVLTAAAAMRTTVLGQRIARNEAERMMALQAAEAALRDGELDIMGRQSNGALCGGSTVCRSVNIALQGLVEFSSACAAGLCDARSRTQGLLPPASEDGSLWTDTGNSVEYGRFTGAAPIPAVSRQPRYAIEGFRFTDAGVYYRITAIGYGSDVQARVMLQSNFKP